MLKIVLVTALLFVLNGCPSLEDTAKITIKNISDSDVKNIALVYYHGQNGKQTKNIDELKHGAHKTIEVALQNSPAIMTYTSSVEMQYYCNDKKYDVHNEENVNRGDDGTPYTNAYIGGGNNVIFSINNNGYSVKQD